MKCPKCGVENGDGVNFCVSCGENLAQEPKTEPQVAEQKPNGNDFVAKVVGFVKTNLKKIITVAVAVVLVILVICMFKSCAGNNEIDYTKHPLLVYNSDDVMLKLTKDKEVKVLSDKEDFASKIKITEDGKTMFFGMDLDGGEFNLCRVKTGAKDLEAKTETLVKGITDYRISADGKTVFYLKNEKLFKMNPSKPDKAVQIGKKGVSGGFDNIDITSDYKHVIYNDDEGNVYLATEKWNTKILKDGGSAFFTEEDKRIMVYESTYDEKDYSYTYEISFRGLGQNDKLEKLDSKIEDWCFIGDDHKKVYLIKKGDLYYKDGKKDGEKILDDAESVYSVRKDGKEEFFAVVAKEKKDEDGYVTETERTLYLLDKTEAVELLEDYSESFGYYDVLVSSKYDEKKGETKTEYSVRVGKKVFDLDLPENSGQFEIHDGYLYVIQEIDKDDEDRLGTLVKYKVNNKGVSADGKVIAEDVYSFYFGSEDNNTEKFIYLDDGDGTRSVYNGRKVVEVTGDFYSSMKKDGKIWYFAEDYNSEEGTYSLAKFNGKDSVVFADDVKDTVVISDKYIYFVNEDDELYVTNGKKGKEKLIFDDVTSITHPSSYVVADIKADDDYDYGFSDYEWEYRFDDKDDKDDEDDDE